MISKPQSSLKCGENELFAKSNTPKNGVIAEDYAVNGKLDEFTNQTESLGVRLLTAEEEVALAHKMKQGDVEARDKLILSNLKLVEFVARQYVERGVELEDLVQSGYIGLITATEKFDSSKGYKFSTYATWWIRKEIMGTIHKNGRTIRIPEYLKDKFDKVLRAKSKYESENGEEPSVQVLAKILGESEDKVKECLFLSKPVVSIYDLIGEMDGEVDRLLASEADDPEEALEKKDLYEILGEAVSSLKEREQEVIRLRFGLADGEIKTQQAIADRLKVSRQYVRQIEDKALTKLRYPTFIQKLLNYYDQRN